MVRQHDLGGAAGSGRRPAVRRLPFEEKGSPSTSSTTQAGASTLRAWKGERRATRSERCAAVAGGAERLREGRVALVHLWRSRCSRSATREALTPPPSDAAASRGLRSFLETSGNSARSGGRPTAHHRGQRRTVITTLAGASRSAPSRRRSHRGQLREVWPRLDLGRALLDREGTRGYSPRARSHAGLEVDLIDRGDTRRTCGRAPRTVEWIQVFSLIAHLVGRGDRNPSPRFRSRAGYERPRRGGRPTSGEVRITRRRAEQPGGPGWSSHSARCAGTRAHGDRRSHEGRQEVSLASRNRLERSAGGPIHDGRISTHRSRTVQSVKGTLGSLEGAQASRDVRDEVDGSHSDACLRLADRSSRDVEPRRHAASWRPRAVGSVIRKTIAFEDAADEQQLRHAPGGQAQPGV